jgi:hypothetical protein
MARFSDRLVSANKLIIAAAVLYAGAVSFAHAGKLPASHIHPDGYVNPGEQAPPHKQRGVAIAQCLKLGAARFDAGKMDQAQLEAWAADCTEGQDAPDTARMACAYDLGRVEAGTLVGAELKAWTKTCAANGVAD